MELKHQVAVLGGGCFWCLDAAYRQINGIVEVVSGYAGGGEDHPTYEQVASGRTGHAEVVKITFDPSQISYPDILDIFWALHDPTTLNRQGADVGGQYRSVIFYQDDEQKVTAQQSIRRVQELWPGPIVTELVALSKFYPAEHYHQNYFDKNPASAYCQVVINPKLAKLRANFTSRLKA
jgi:peptide-methionine (S)-S-oxide reductase